MLMQAHTDALQRSAKPPRWRSRQAAQRSEQNRRDVGQSDKAAIGRDVFALYNHTGTIVVASAWLAVYLIAAIPSFITSSLPFVAWLR